MSYGHTRKNRLVYPPAATQGLRCSRVRMGAGLDAVALYGRDGVGSAPQKQNPARREPAGLKLHPAINPGGLVSQDFKPDAEAEREILEAPRASGAVYITKSWAVNTFYITPALSSFPMRIALASPRI